MKSFAEKWIKVVKFNQRRGYLLKLVLKPFLKRHGAHDSTTDQAKQEKLASKSKMSSDFRQPPRPPIDPGQGGQINSSS